MVKRDTEWISRLLYPKLTSLVTCVDKSGRSNIITIALAMPVSSRPPIIAICIRPSRHSYKMIKETKQFVVNIPSANLAKHATFCGTVSGKDVDKFKETGLKASRAKKVKAPIIEECMGHIECQVIREISVGDHSMFLGKVVAAYAEESCFDEEWILGKALPILLLGGRRTPLYTTPRETFTARQGNKGKKKSNRY